MNFSPSQGPINSTLWSCSFLSCENITLSPGSAARDSVDKERWVSNTWAEALVDNGNSPVPGRGAVLEHGSMVGGELPGRGTDSYEAGTRGDLEEVTHPQSHSGFTCHMGTATAALSSRAVGRVKWQRTSRRHGQLLAAQRQLPLCGLLRVPRSPCPGLSLPAANLSPRQPPGPLRAWESCSTVAATWSPDEAEADSRF